MARKDNPIAGSFFTSYDKKTLYRVAAEVSPAYFLVESYVGLEMTGKQVWPIAKITGFPLYPDFDSALASEVGSK
jgi:hypothetical protein